MTTSPAAPAPLGPQQVPDPWNAVASTYAEDMAQWHAYVDEALAMASLGPAHRILDLASGPGTLALRASQRVAHVAAVDFSPEMIAELRARATSEGAANVEAAVMDAGDLAFGDASFDAAFCLFGFFFFPDRARAFSELRRVLRPGAPAVIGTWSPIERRPIMQVGFEAMAEAMPQLPRPGKGALQDPAECVREMSEAGFREVEARLFQASTHFDSPAHYLDTVIRSAAPFAALKKKLPAPAWDEARARLLASVEKRIPAGGIDLSAEAIFTRGIA